MKLFTAGLCRNKARIFLKENDLMILYDFFKNLTNLLPYTLCNLRTKQVCTPPYYYLKFSGIYIRRFTLSQSKYISIGCHRPIYCTSVNCSLLWIFESPQFSKVPTRLLVFSLHITECVAVIYVCYAWGSGRKN